MEYWILLILSTFMCFIIQVTGVSFTFSESKVIKGTGDIVLTCGVDETNILSVLVMQIKIFLGKESVQLGMVQAGKNVTNTEPAGLADRMRISGSIDANEPRKSQLILTINKDKILCTDGTLYECYLAYATSSVTNPEIKTDATNGTLEVYVYPSIMSLRGKRNGVDVEGSTVVNQARFKVGDELELICDANIGSIPNTDIQWKRTSEISSEDMWLDYSPPPGTSSQTAATYEDCKYTRTGRIMYKMTLADANRKSNLGFLCYVRVTGPPYNQYETTENPKFYAEVAGGNSESQEAVASAGEPKTAVNKAETKTEINVGIPVGVSVAGILIVGIVVTFIVILTRKGVLFEKTSTQAAISSGGTEPHYYNGTQNVSAVYSGLQTGVSDDHTYTVIGPQVSTQTNISKEIHSVNVTNKSSVYSTLQRSGTEDHAYQILD